MDGYTCYGSEFLCSLAIAAFIGSCVPTHELVMLVISYSLFFPGRDAICELLFGSSISNSCVRMNTSNFVLNNYWPRDKITSVVYIQDLKFRDGTRIMVC